MPLLVKGVYGCETDPKKTPFGLLNQQIRIGGVLNNAGWFNSSGEKLGYGDITIRDIHRVSTLIPKGESFIALAEFETSWSIPSHLDSSAPGIDYVMQNCVWFIGHGLIYRVRADGLSEEVDRDGVKYTRISRQQFFKLTGYDIKKVPQTPVKSKEKISESMGKDYEYLVNKVKAAMAAAKAPTKPAPKYPKIPAAGSGKFVGYKSVKNKSP